MIRWIMKYIPLLLICVLLGCSSNKKQQAPVAGVPVINLSENVIKVSSLPLSEAVAGIEVVQLEATDKSYIGEIHRAQVTEHDIWIKPEKGFYIYRFSRSGNYLNWVGKIGQGPGEYASCADFFIDEMQKEVYIVSSEKGILVYDFEGNFKRMATYLRESDIFMSAETQHLLFNKCFFISQNMNFYNPTAIADSLWSFAWVDNAFNKKKIFKNPVHIGKEKQIIENKASMDKMVNYWTESVTNIDTYSDQLTLKYPDTDTIYQYSFDTEMLVPQYSVFTKEEKGDYEVTHKWFKEREAFNYFTITSYYPSREFIYLVGNKGDKIYTYCYNKQDGTVRVEERQGEITERKVPWFNIPYRRMERPFVLNNDLCGGDFTVEHRSLGRYWVNVLEPDNANNWIDINLVKTSLVKDEDKKQEFIKVLESINEDSNPILLIATLK